MAVAVWWVADQPAWLIPLMIAAAVSDLLDGRFARAIREYRLKRGEDPGNLAGVGGVGAWLDPLCDKTFVVSLLAAIYVTHRPSLLIVLAIGAREFFLVPMGLFYRLSARMRKLLEGFDFRAGMLGKLATVAQFVAIGAIPAYPQAVPYAAAASGLTGLGAVIVYTKRVVLRYRANAAEE
jgi:phosphatidylglycerophosphate synthase